MTSCLEEAQPTPDGNPSVCSGLVETAESPVLDGRPAAVESEQKSKTEQLVVVEKPKESSDPARDKDGE